MRGVVVRVRLPEIPVMVTVTVPVAAVLLAASVSVLVVVVGFGLKATVTPLGRMDVDRFTLPVKPFSGETVIVLVPVLPWVTVTLLGEAERVEAGAGGPLAVRITVAVLGGRLAAVRLSLPSPVKLAA